MHRWIIIYRLIDTSYQLSRLLYCACLCYCLVNLIENEFDICAAFAYGICYRVHGDNLFFVFHSVSGSRKTICIAILLRQDCSQYLHRVFTKFLRQTRFGG